MNNPATGIVAKLWNLRAAANEEPRSNAATRKSRNIEIHIPFRLAEPTN